MSKSDFKKVIAANARHCIEIVGDPSSTVESFPVVIQDLACDLSSAFGKLAKSEHMCTLDDLIRSVFRTAVLAVSKGVQLWIAVQDKATCVTPAKQPEWNKRAVNKVQASVAVPDAHQFSVQQLHELEQQLEVQSTIPKTGSEWYNIFNHSDRQNKNFVVRQFTARAKTVVARMMQDQSVPLHHRIVLDCEQMPFVEGCGSTATWHAAAPVIHCLSSIRPQHHSAEQVREAVAFDQMLEVQLSNKLGEYDVAFLHHLQAPIVQDIALQTAHGGIVLETVDTDILVIAALRADAVRVPTRVKLGLPKNIRMNYGDGIDDPNAKFLFDPSAVRHWICETLRSHLIDSENLTDQELMQNFCLVYIMGGSDFCHDPIPNTSSETLLTEYLKQGGPPDDFLYSMLTKTIDVLQGRVNKSQSARSTQQLHRGIKLQSKGLKSGIQFGTWIANDYWSNSAHPERIVTSPIGHGTALKGGSLVFAASV